MKSKEERKREAYEAYLKIEEPAWDEYEKKIKEIEDSTKSKQEVKNGNTKKS